MLRAGMLTSIHIPTSEEESLRDLVRYRETMRTEVHRSKQHVLKLLQRHGLSEPECKRWGGAFWTWLRKLELPGHTGETLELQIALLSTKIDQLDSIDRRLEEVWRGSDRLRGPVGRLRCLRGIDTLSALVLVTEIVDIMRFASPRALMGWLGLVPFAYGILLIFSDAGIWPGFGLFPSSPEGGLMMLERFGAGILAFMGGCLWGFASSGRTPSLPLLAGAAAPALAAIIAIQPDPALSCVWLASGYALLQGIDVFYQRAGIAPAYWLSLRLPLTAGVMAALLAGALYG
jgi:hypothetical protein